MGRRSRFESWRSRTSTSTRRTETGRPHSCSCRKKLEKAALRIMEAKDIDVNAKDKHGCTALMFACRHKLEKAALRILEFKDVNAKDRFGRTVFRLACKNKLETVALRILEAKDVNAKDSEERPPSYVRRLKEPLK